MLKPNAGGRLTGSRDPYTGGWVSPAGGGGGAGYLGVDSTYPCAVFLGKDFGLYVCCWNVRLAPTKAEGANTGKGGGGNRAHGAGLITKLLGSFTS